MESDFRSFLSNERTRFVNYVRSLVIETAEMEAEDIVQDVFIKLLERADLVAPMEFQPAYVYRSLRNRVIDLMRTSRNYRSLDEEVNEDGLTFSEVIGDDGPGPEDILQTTEGQARLFEALAQLSDIEQKVIIAHDFEGKSFKEIANDTGLRQNTLLSHKRRGVLKLKTLLASEKGDLK